MVQAEVTIGSSQGIHLRPANKIVNLADKFNSVIHLKTEYMDVSVKSIINLVSGTFRYGDKVTLICSGPDEKEALAAIKKILESDLDIEDDAEYDIDEEDEEYYRRSIRRKRSDRFTL